MFAFQNMLKRLPINYPFWLTTEILDFCRADMDIKRALEVEGRALEVEGRASVSPP